MSRVPVFFLHPAIQPWLPGPSDGRMRCLGRVKMKLDGLAQNASKMVKSCQCGLTQKTKAAPKVI